MSEKFIRWSLTLKLARVVTMSIVIIAVSVISAGISTMAVAQTYEDPASVYEFVKSYQQTINRHDPMALAAFFTEDADLMMFNLPRVHGRQAIENWWQDFWQSKFNRQEPGRRGTFNLNSVRFLDDDVAIVNVETLTGGKDSLGVELQTRRARGTWLLNQQNGKWLISTMCGMPTEGDSIMLGASINTAKSLRPHIRAFVDAYEDAYDSHNPAAVTAFFQDDADIIVRNKPSVHGKQAIQEWWSSYFSTPRNFKVIMIIDEIHEITNDVVQINLTVTGAIPGTENNLHPVRQTSAMWVLVRGIEGWRIAALRVLPGKEDQIIRNFDNRN